LGFLAQGIFLPIKRMFSMKRLSLIAICVLSVTQANAVSVLNNQYGSIDMTGRAYAGHMFGDERKSELYGSDTFARLGLKGKSKIDDKFTAVGAYEAQLNVGDKASSTTIPTNDTEKNDSLATRLAYGGVSNSDWGTVTFGRQNGAANLVTAWTDVALADGYGNNGLGVGTDKFATKRASDVLKYSAVFGNAQLDTDYKFRNTQDTCASTPCDSKNGAETVVDKNNAAYGTALAYKLTPLISAGASYTVGKQGSLDDASLWTTGLKYDDKSWYAAFNYGKGNNWLSTSKSTTSTIANLITGVVTSSTTTTTTLYDHTGYETALGYTFLNGLGLMSTWNKQIAESSAGKKTNTVNYYTLGASYKFNRRLSLLGEYRVNNKDASSFIPAKDSATGLAVDAANDFQVAVKYDF
jgi:outer membrane pore protein E